MMSRLDSQQTIPNKDSYALDEQLRQNIILLSPSWEAKKIDFSADLEPASYTEDAAMMSHIWLNLLNNAIKFTPEGGSITVSLKKDVGNLLVSVADTGKGMSEEVISRIFNKYYQGDASHSDCQLR